MPYKPNYRGIRRKDRRIPLTDKQLEHLIFGWTWLDSDFPFKSEKDRRKHWQRHSQEIMGMMTDDENSKGLHPYLLVGMRPDAWFEYEDVPPLKDGQTVPEYLSEHDLWLPNEKQNFLAMKEREEKLLKLLGSMTDNNAEFKGDWQ
jgi:hypothetical protein